MAEASRCRHRWQVGGSGQVRGSLEGRRRIERPFDRQRGPTDLQQCREGRRGRLVPGSHREGQGLSRREQRGGGIAEPTVHFGQRDQGVGDPVVGPDRRLPQELDGATADLERFVVALESLQRLGLGIEHVGQSGVVSFPTIFEGMPGGDELLEGLVPSIQTAQGQAGAESSLGLEVALGGGGRWRRDVEGLMVGRQGGIEAFMAAPKSGEGQQRSGARFGGTLGKQLDGLGEEGRRILGLGVFGKTRGEGDVRSGDERVGGIESLSDQCDDASVDLSGSRGLVRHRVGGGQSEQWFHHAEMLGTVRCLDQLDDALSSRDRGLELSSGREIGRSRAQERRFDLRCHAQALGHRTRVLPRIADSGLEASHAQGRLELHQAMTRGHRQPQRALERGPSPLQFTPPLEDSGDPHGDFRSDQVTVAVARLVELLDLGPRFFVMVERQGGVDRVEAGPNLLHPRIELHSGSRVESSGQRSRIAAAADVGEVEQRGHGGIDRGAIGGLESDEEPLERREVALEAATSRVPDRRRLGLASLLHRAAPGRETISNRGSEEGQGRIGVRRTAVSKARA